MKPCHWRDLNERRLFTCHYKGKHYGSNTVIYWFQACCTNLCCLHTNSFHWRKLSRFHSAANASTWFYDIWFPLFNLDSGACDIFMYYWLFCLRWWTLCNELLCTHLIGHHLKCLNNSTEVSNKAVRKLILKCYMLHMQYFNTDSALE